MAGLEVALHPALVIGPLVSRENAPSAAGTAGGTGTVAHAVGETKGRLVCQLDRL